jgi:hypothetical protein
VLPVAAGVLVLAVLAGGWLVYSRDSGSSGATVPREYDGVWSGTVRQDDGINPKTVPVRLTLHRDSKSTTVGFSASGCGGALSLNSADSTGLTFTLTATGGSDCIGGQLKVYRSGAELVYDLSGDRATTQNGRLSRSQ